MRSPDEVQPPSVIPTEMDKQDYTLIGSKFHLHPSSYWLIISLFFLEFSKYSASELIAEVKQLQNLAYQLGLEEAKEMTRGKYLNILTRKARYWQDANNLTAPHWIGRGLQRMAMFKIYRQIKSELVYHCIFVLAKYKRVNHSYFLLLITRDYDTFILSGAFLFSRHCTICFHFNLFFFKPTINNHLTASVSNELTGWQLFSSL